MSGECRGGGGPSAVVHQVNGFCNTLLDQSIRQANSRNNHLQNHLNDIETTKMDATESGSLNGESSSGKTGATPKRLNSQEGPQPTGLTNGHGSPMRSQLGLKLKTKTTSGSKHYKTPVKSPLECPLCSYKSDTSNVLEEHINRIHFDPLSPSVNSLNNNNNNNGSSQSHEARNNATLGALQCPICARIFPTISDLELHVNIEHKEILSPSPMNGHAVGGGGGAMNGEGEHKEKQMNMCPMCECSFDNMRLPEMEQHIESHFGKSPQSTTTAKIPIVKDKDKEAKRLREERDFEMLRAQYGMDNQGNFREQSSAAMQRAVYAGEMSVADYYERQVRGER